MESSTIIIPRFATIWIAVGSVICIWDACYILSRPASMFKGSLFWLFQPYAKYITLDPLYGNLNNSFVIAQSYVNCIEVIFGLLSIILFHYCRTIGMKNFSSLLLLLVSVATLAKTILYFINDIVDIPLHPDQHPDNIPLFDYFFLFLLPNITWVLLPSAIIYNISNQILTALNKTKSKKN